MMGREAILMCQPTDSWGTETCPSYAFDKRAAEEQWNKLYKVLTEELEVEVHTIEASERVDSVFAARLGLVLDIQQTIILNKAVHQQYLEKLKNVLPDYKIYIPQHSFGGEADALLEGETIFAGYPKYTEIGCHSELANLTRKQVLSLQIGDGFGYLSDVLCVLSESSAVYYPAAFDEYARRVLQFRFSHLIEINCEEQALRGTNTIKIRDRLVMPTGCSSLKNALLAKGYETIEVNVSEFVKLGGGVSQLVLRIPEPICKPHTRLPTRPAD